MAAREIGWVAQPAAHLFDRREGFRPTRTDRDPRIVISQRRSGILALRRREDVNIE